jgi:single-strand DNA-binding protein
MFKRRGLGGRTLKRKRMKNYCKLLGRLGRDPEVRDLGEGKKLARFGMATNEFQREKDGTFKEITTWHDVVVWGKLADFAGQQLKKGMKVQVEGKLVKRKYMDKDGKEHVAIEVNAKELLPVAAVRESEPSEA